MNQPSVWLAVHYHSLWILFLFSFFPLSSESSRGLSARVCGEICIRKDSSFALEASILGRRRNTERTCTYSSVFVTCFRVFGSPRRITRELLMRRNGSSFLIWTNWATIREFLRFSLSTDEGDRGSKTGLVLVSFRSAPPKLVVVSPWRRTRNRSGQTVVLIRTAIGSLVSVVVHCDFLGTNCQKARKNKISPWYSVVARVFSFVWFKKRRFFLYCTE